MNRFVAIGRSPEIIKKPLFFIAFCRLGALLGSPLDRLGAILVPSWRVSLPLWVSVASFTPSWRNFCSLLASPWALLVTFGSLLVSFRLRLGAQGRVGPAGGVATLPCNPSLKAIAY